MEQLDEWVKEERGQIVLGDHYEEVHQHNDVCVASSEKCDSWCLVGEIRNPCGILVGSARWC